MDCCNYLEYRNQHHYPYNVNPAHCYQPQYYQQRPYFDSTEVVNYEADYVYNPKEARLRKALREQSRENRSSLSRQHSAALLHHQHAQHSAAVAQRTGPAPGPAPPPPAPGVAPGVAAGASANGPPPPPPPAGVAWGRAAGAGPPPAAFAAPGAARGLRSTPSKMLMDRSLEDMRNKIREQVEQGIVSNYPETMMEFEPISTYSLGQMGMPGGGDYAVVSDIDSHAWYSFAQASQHNGSSYVMRHSDDKVLPGNWNIHYTADGHPQQGVPYLMRSQMISSSGPYNGTLNQSPHPSASGPGINRSNPSQPSYQIYSPFSTSNHQNKNIIKKPELNEEEQTRLLENIPTSSSSPSSSNENTNTTLQQKGVISNSNSTPDGMCHKQSELNSNKKPSGTPTVSPSTVGDDKNVNSESAGENRPLPTFEQAFGSTEIGRYSHEGIFSGTQHNTQHQGPQNSDSKYILGKSSGTYDALPSTNLFSPSCDEYQHGFAPFILSSPSGKLESSDTLLPQSSWPSMFYYTPAAIPLPAAFFDYALLPGVPTATDFIPTGPDETVLIDIPNAPGVYNRNDFQVTCNGERTSIYSAENAFRDCEEGVGYVTLHIPASTMSTVNTYSFPNENGKSSQSLKTEQFLDKTGKESPEGSIKADMYDENKIKYKVSGIEEDEKQKEDVKNECSQENSDELKRQNLTITGMPMQEPIVISQNERICVIMDAPTSDTDYSGF